MLCCSKVSFTVLKEIKPDDDLEKVETCRLIDYIVALCASILSRNTYFTKFTNFLDLFRCLQFYNKNVCPSHQNVISDTGTCWKFVLCYVELIRRCYRTQGRQIGCYRTQGRQIRCYRTQGRQIRCYRTQGRHVTLMRMGWPSGVWNAK